MAKTIVQETLKCIHSAVDLHLFPTPFLAFLKIDDHLFLWLSTVWWSNMWWSYSICIYNLAQAVNDVCICDLPVHHLSKTHLAWHILLAGNDSLKAHFNSSRLIEVLKASAPNTKKVSTLQSNSLGILPCDNCTHVFAISLQNPVCWR